MLSAAVATPDASAEHDLSARSDAQLEDDLTGLSAHLNAATYRFLELLAEFDGRGAWAGWGMRSCAHWLSWKCGVGLVAARDKVRVARALRGLPAIADAMRRGVVSYSKVRAITRVATPATESFLLAVAENGTASHVERLVREQRRGERARELHDEVQRHGTRQVGYRWDEDGSLVLEARLPPEQGALLVQALQAAGDELREQQWVREGDCAEASATTPGQRQADALVRCAEGYLAGGGGGGGAGALPAGQRHEVQVQVDAEVLCDAQADGDCGLGGGPSIPPETARRLACDGALVTLVRDGAGNTLDVGRRTRAIPPAMRRALERRDGGCRFPGCSCTRFVDGHHVRHWAHGGETSLDNLVLLCRHHHRLVHEHGYGVEARGERLRFLRPDGSVIEDAPRAPAPVAPQLRVPLHARTAIPSWMGEPLDYTYCLTALQQRQDAARERDDSAESPPTVH